MIIQSGDINDDDDNIIDEEEEGSSKSEPHGETHIAPTNEISSRDPVIINR
ncbi:MAG: hypothetical protein ACMG50_01000 [Thermomonas sp.]